MLKSLADRLAEAAAEWLHLQIRTQYWGYAGDEASTNDELIAEQYKGIRPAPGYPACPDHTAKRELFALLDAPANAGMNLTESCAMMPAAAVSGFYIGHPAGSYFAIPKIGRDQLEDWARRKGMTSRTPNTGWRRCSDGLASQPSRHESRPLSPMQFSRCFLNRLQDRARQSTTPSWSSTCCARSRPPPWLLARCARPFTRWKASPPRWR
jgi:hypothetical protein